MKDGLALAKHGSTWTVSAPHAFLPYVTVHDPGKAPNVEDAVFHEVKNVFRIDAKCCPEIHAWLTVRTRLFVQVSSCLAVADAIVSPVLVMRSSGGVDSASKKTCRETKGRWRVGVEDGEGRTQFGRNRRRRKTQRTEEDKVRSEMPTPWKTVSCT